MIEAPQQHAVQGAADNGRGFDVGAALGAFDQEIDDRITNACQVPCGAQFGVCGTESGE